jgi:polyhydroxybutyrate depolymerase
MRTKILPLLMLFLLALSACSFFNQATNLALPETPPAQPAPTEPAGAASTPAPITLAEGNHDLTMIVDGLARSYILHVPPAVQSGKALPLVLVLHGTYGTGQKMQLGLGFDPYADQGGFYVAYPTAYQKPGERETARWNDGRGTLESSLAGIDDVKFLVSLVDDVAARVALDKSRVFVTGVSNGGMMTYRLGCETAGVFAGIAPVIGNLPEPIFAACSPSAPLNVLAINGDADPFVPFAGGQVCGSTPSRLCEGGEVMSQPESLGKFAAANGCALAPQSVSLPAAVDDGTSIEQQRFANCAGAAQVEAFIVHNGGHTWPPRASQLSAGGQATANLEATPLIVDFFFGEESALAAAPPTASPATLLYISGTIHIESKPLNWPDVDALLDFLQQASALGMRWSVGADPGWLEGEPRAAELIQASEALGVQWDVHTHHLEDRARAAYLISQFGGHPTTVYSGFLIDELEAFLPALSYRGSSWTPQVLWGAVACPGHRPGCDEQSAGLWSPLSGNEYLTHNPNGRIIHVGGGAHQLSGAIGLAQAIAKGEHPFPIISYTIMVSPATLQVANSQDGMPQLAQFVEEMEAYPFVRWATIEETALAWTEAGHTPSRIPLVEE